MIDFKVFWGFAFRRTDKQTDICDCRVTFATEKPEKHLFYDVLNYDGQTERQMDICDCRVTFATENPYLSQDSASKWLCIYRKTLYTEFFENVALFWLCKTFKINQISVFANLNNAKSLESPIFQIIIYDEYVQSYSQNCCRKLFSVFLLETFIFLSIFLCFFKNCQFYSIFGSVFCLFWAYQVLGSTEHVSNMCSHMSKHI